MYFVLLKQENLSKDSDQVHVQKWIGEWVKQSCNREKLNFKEIRGMSGSALDSLLRVLEDVKLLQRDVLLVDEENRPIQGVLAKSAAREFCQTLCDMFG